MSMENFELKMGTGDTEKSKKVHERKSNLEKSKELATFCSENGNPIKFIEYGEDFDLEKKDGIKLISRRHFLTVLKNYLKGPIFTDKFEKNHSIENGRRAWEKEVESKLRNQKKDTFKYYLANRLGFNKSLVLSIQIKNLFNSLKDSEIKNKLQIIKDKIPLEIIGDSKRRYHELEDAEKIEVIKNFSEVIRELIIFLENKS